MECMVRLVRLGVGGNFFHTLGSLSSGFPVPPFIFVTRIFNGTSTTCFIVVSFHTLEPKTFFVGSVFVLTSFIGFVITMPSASTKNVVVTAFHLV